MGLDLIVLTAALFHNHDGSVSRELAVLREAGATDRKIATRFMELYPECRSVPTIGEKGDSTRGGDGKLPDSISLEDE